MEIGIQHQNANFNPRPREEGDLLRYQLSQRTTYFNPRPREEGDERFLMYSQEFIDFNPRPREEGDSQIGCKIDLIIHFNPRPREEGDFSLFTAKFSNVLISIHALVKRATFEIPAVTKENIFQSTPS